MSIEMPSQPLSQDSSIVVFGGAGFVGTHLLEFLSQSGFKKLISVDIAEPRRRIDGVEYIERDIRDLSDFDVDLSNPVFFNFAAVHTTPGHDPWEYYNTNVHGATSVVRLARRYDVKTIVFTSSISVYGPDEIPKDEDTAPTPNSDYGHSKLMAESIHIDWAAEADDRRLVIARPAVVFGLGENGNFTRLSKLLDKGVFVYPGRRDTIKSCIYVKDLIAWMFHALTVEEKCTIFNGSYSNRYTIEEIVNTFMKVSYPKSRSITIPATVLRGAASILKPVSQATGLGIHPDRITKLMVSTNILPTWAEKSDLETRDRLEWALTDWKAQGGGKFL